MKISVVIATLGGSQLGETIVSLQRGTIIPDEILVCIPNSYEPPSNVSSYDNVHIVRTERKGQVYQRSIGFDLALNELVLQLDDDVLLEKTTIEVLAHTLNIIGGKASISPAFYIKDTKVPLYRSEKNSFAWQCVCWIMNGSDSFQPGRVSKSGVNFDLDFYDSFDAVNESDWLPGGCVLHKKGNLIMNDFYPFQGKAYSEDLIHSWLLKNNDVSLHVCNDASVYIDRVESPTSLTEIYKKYRSVKYCAVLSKRNLFRLRAYYFIRAVFFLLSRK